MADKQTLQCNKSMDSTFSKQREKINDYSPNHTELWLSSNANACLTAFTANSKIILTIVNGLQND